MSAASFRNLRLPAASPDAVRLYNALSRFGRSVKLPLAAGSLRAALALPPSLAASEPESFCTAAIRAEVDGSPWTIRLNDRGASLLLSHPVFNAPALEGASLADLPEALASAVAAALLEPAAAKLSAALGAEVRILGFSWRPAGAKLRPATAALTLSPLDLPKLGPEPLAASLSAPPEAIERLEEKLRALPAANQGMLAEAADAIPVDVAFEAGRMGLSAEAYAALAPGDVLMPEDWLPRREALQAALWSARRRIALCACRWENDKREAALEESWRLAEENSMQTTDDLEVELAFELERRRLTMGELKSLSPGYVFRLAADPASPVTIVANGRPVARGRLVDVNGALGVELQAPLGGATREAAHDD